jgi:hypothetical protein
MKKPIDSETRVAQIGATITVIGFAIQIAGNAIK